MKKFAGLIVYALLLITTGIIGKLAGVSENILTLNLHLNLGSVLSAVASVLILLIVERLTALVLGCLKPKSHRAAREVLLQAAY